MESVQSESNILPEELVGRTVATERLQSECKTFPQDLVAMIVAMMPFPSIFKARTLSKSWRTNFSAVSSIDDKAGKEFAISFQKQVRRWSYKWETFCPVSFGEKLGTTFDNAFRNGSKCLPSLCSLRIMISTSSYQELEGPLLCAYTLMEECSRSSGLHESSEGSLFVANIFTKSWKQLPSRPNNRSNNVSSWKKLVRDTSLETYKVIVLIISRCLGITSDFSIHTYDSTSDGWTSKDLAKHNDERVILPRFCHDFPIYLNGFLYLACIAVDNILAVNVHDGTWEEIIMTSSPVDDSLPRRSMVRLVVCDARLLRMDFMDYFDEMRVLEIDLVSRKLLMVERDPPSHFKNPPDVDMRAGTSRAIRALPLEPFSDGHKIFIWTIDQMLTYDVKEDHWRWFPILLPDTISSDILGSTESSAFCFQPGSNPFAEV